MKDKEKQIEEMAKVLSTVKRCEALALSECIKKKCEYPHYEGVTCIAEHQAETLYEQGYRKLPKNSVVLSKGEHNKLILCYVNYERLVEQFNQAYNLGSKETAEKFLQLAYDRSLEKSFIKKVEELAKQFGVEIKE